LTQTRQWLIQELRGTGAQVEEDPFVANTPIGPIPMNNLIAKFRGSGRETVIVAGHYDTKRFDEFRFLGANDGGSSAALLVELARVLGTRRNALDYWLVFLTGKKPCGIGPLQTAFTEAGTWSRSFPRAVNSAAFRLLSWLT